MSEDLVKSDADHHQIESEIARDQKHGQPNRFPKPLQKNTTQEGDQKECYHKSMASQKMRGERVFDHVRGGVRR